MRVENGDDWGHSRACRPLERPERDRSPVAGHPTARRTGRRSPPAPPSPIVGQDHRRARRSSPPARRPSSSGWTTIRWKPAAVPGRLSAGTSRRCTGHPLPSPGCTTSAPNDHERYPRCTAIYRFITTTARTHVPITTHHCPSHARRYPDPATPPRRARPPDTAPASGQASGPSDPPTRPSACRAPLPRSVGPAIAARDAAPEAWTAQTPTPRLGSNDRTLRTCPPIPAPAHYLPVAAWFIPASPPYIPIHTLSLPTHG